MDQHRIFPAFTDLALVYDQQTSEFPLIDREHSC
jgi:hypothetical protein